MGFESFRVELRGGTATPTQILDVVRQLPQVRPDTGSVPTRGSTYFTIKDGLHVLELEVVESPLRISCRFTLCHPPTVDLALLSIVRELMARTGMSASVLEAGVPDHLRWLPLDQFEEFAAQVRRFAATARAGWVAQFGPAQFPARTPEAFERFILPRCEPATEWPS